MDTEGQHSHGHDIHGYAIVCRNDCIADADGRLPPDLMNDADWQHFQNELDLSDLVIVGRGSHEAAPNAKKRPRLILSRSSSGLARATDGWWWNPDLVPWPEVVDRLDLAGKRLAVPGGQAVFDRFLAIGFATFHLSQAGNAFLAGGRKVFAGVTGDISAETVLRGAGLRPGPAQVLDAGSNITLRVFAAPDVAAGGRSG